MIWISSVRLKHCQLAISMIYKEDFSKQYYRVAIYQGSFTIGIKYSPIFKTPILASNSKCKLSVLLRRCDILKITFKELHLVQRLWKVFTSSLKVFHSQDFKREGNMVDAFEWLGVEFAEGLGFFLSYLSPRAYLLLFFVPTLIKLTNGGSTSDEAALPFTK